MLRHSHLTLLAGVLVAATQGCAQQKAPPRAGPQPNPAAAEASPQAAGAPAAAESSQSPAPAEPSPPAPKTEAASAADSNAVKQDDLPPPKTAPPPDPRTEARARRLVQKGMQNYSKGEYDRAEELLKEAVTLYPFLPEANLALGKIFLIRGSALRDRAMINSARLMFEMARALDPNMREPAVLLQLFQSSPPE